MNDRRLQVRDKKLNFEYVGSCLLKFTTSMNNNREVITGEPYQRFFNQEVRYRKTEMRQLEKENSLQKTGK